MGFDDILFDNRIEEKTKTMLNELIGCYDYENWDDLESMETGTHYSAYSLIWSQLYNINFVMMVGMSPFAPNPEMIQKLKKKDRKEVLEMFMEVQGRCARALDDSFVAVREHDLCANEPSC